MIVSLIDTALAKKDILISVFRGFKTGGLVYCLMQRKSETIQFEKKEHSVF